MCNFSIIILALENHYSLNLSHLNSYVLFLKFPGVVGTEEEDQVGPPAPEDSHDSSTDTCLTFPYRSNSPRPFPPSPVHSVTDSPIRVSPLFIALAITLLFIGPLTTTLLCLLHPLLLFSHLPKPLLLSLPVRLLVLSIILFIPPTFLVLFPIQDL